MVSISGIFEYFDFVNRKNLKQTMYRDGSFAGVRKVAP